MPPSLWLRRSLFKSIATEQERNELAQLEFLVLSLESYAKNFGSALALFDHAETLIQESFKTNNNPTEESAFGWVFIAARDAAITVYHFCVSLDAIGAQVQFCPTVRSKFDFDALKTARKLFRSQFSAAEKIRHAVAHQAELLKSTAAMTRTRDGRSGGRSSTGILSIGNLLGRRYETTHDGEQISFEISKESLARLEGVVARVYGAFRPLSEMQAG
jgi:hypothetical protein